MWTAPAWGLVVERCGQTDQVLITGATGFVGQAVVRHLIARGVRPVCLVRNRDRLYRQHPGVESDRLVAIRGDLSDQRALAEACEQCQACVHLVGIILERRLAGQTFRKVHVDGTRNVVKACGQAGINRYVHMSALGTGPGSTSRYHKSKWAAEQIVEHSGLAWTIFQPSVIHGPHGEFMRLMKRLCLGLVPPVIPCFGSGEALLQPVSVEDVAHCMVEAIGRPATIDMRIPMGGPDQITWRQLYALCQRAIRHGRAPKRVVGLPVPIAKAIAWMSAPPMALAERIVSDVGLLRFGPDHVDMAQIDSICDHTMAEQLFGLQMRGLERDLMAYADAIL